MIAAAPAAASPVVAAHARVAGRTYASWRVAFYRWRLSLPRHTEPTDGRCARRRQRGPVWFLHGNVGSGRTFVTRTCSVPAGRYLMLGTPSTDCSTVERAPHHASGDAAALRACARRAWKREGALAMRLTLDGRRVTPAGFRGVSPAFSFRMPARDNLYRAAGRTRGRAAVAGYATLLRPLRRGSHTLTQDIRYRGGVRVLATYRIRVTG